MRHIRRIGFAAGATIAGLLAMVVPVAAQYPPGPNVRAKEIVAPESTLAFTGGDLAPLFWAVGLLAVGLVLLFAGRRTTVPRDR